METLIEVLSSKLAPMLTMGGYAGYVWPSFLIAAAVMLTMTLLSIRSLRKAQKTLAALQSTPNEA